MRPDHLQQMRSEIAAAVKRQEALNERRMVVVAEKLIEDVAMDAATYTLVCSVFEDFLPECFGRQMDAPSSEAGYYFTHIDTPSFTIRAKFLVCDLRNKEPKIVIELWHTKTFTFEEFQTLDEAIWFADKYGASPMTDKEIKSFYCDCATEP